MGHQRFYFAENKQYKKWKIRRATLGRIANRQMRLAAFDL
jgi:hypothetical protein